MVVSDRPAPGLTFSGRPLRRARWRGRRLAVAEPVSRPSHLGLDQRSQAAVVLVAGPASVEMCPHPRYASIGVRPVQLQPDVAIERLEALLAAQLGPLGAEQALEDIDSARFGCSLMPPLSAPALTASYPRPSPHRTAPRGGWQAACRAVVAGVVLESDPESTPGGRWSCITIRSGMAAWPAPTASR